MINKLLKSGLALSAIMTIAAPSYAVTYNLCAGATSKTIGTDVVAMWGYGTVEANGTCTPTVPGPALTVPSGDSTLTVNLRNDLTTPVSIVINGQSATMAPVFSQMAKAGVGYDHLPQKLQQLQQVLIPGIILNQVLTSIKVVHTLQFRYKWAYMALL